MLSFKEGVFLQIVDDEGICVDINTGSYIRLNETAANILNCLVSKEESDVMKELTAYYNVDEDKLRKDINKVKLQLHELGLFS
jgi:hypothetical protein